MASGKSLEPKAALPQKALIQHRDLNRAQRRARKQWRTSLNAQVRKVKE